MVKYLINYQNKNITKYVSDNLISLTFEDELEGRASSLELVLEDKDRLWMGDWYPETNDKIVCAMGNEGMPLLGCGIFYVDEFNCDINRKQNITTIKALSVPASLLHRHTAFKGYNGKQFGDVAREIAGELGYAVKGDVSGVVHGNLFFKSGIGLLYGLSRRFGYVMRVEDKVIFFEKYVALKKQSTVMIDYTDIISATLKDRAQGRYNTCTCRWWDEKNRVLYSGSASLGVAGGGEAVIWEKVEDNEQASERAEKWLEDKNKQRAEFVITIHGNEKLISGVMVDVRGVGKNSGRCIIKKSKHTITRKNYITEITLNK